MEKQLRYFMIDGGVGGNQDWFTNYMMNRGGCAAATACDTCIFLAREWGMTRLCPYPAEGLTRGEYVAFSQIMKPYISPRPGGVAKLSIYMDGLREYAAAQGVEIPMEPFSGAEDAEEAQGRIKAQIDANLPVPYLLLSHKDKKQFKDMIWHWFLLIGYEETDEAFYVTAATYGEAVKLPFKELWNTGAKPLGGFICYGKPGGKYEIIT